jgi:hypothetical protein
MEWRAHYVGEASESQGGGRKKGQGEKGIVGQDARKVHTDTPMSYSKAVHGMLNPH